MEWAGLAVWLIVASMAPLIARCGTDNASLGIQSLMAMLGLGLAVIYLIAGGPAWMGWVAAGAAVVGLLADTAGTAWLTSGDRNVSAAGQGAEDTNALLLSFQLPLFGAAILVSVLMALHIATIV